MKIFPDFGDNGRWSVGVFIRWIGGRVDVSGLDFFWVSFEIFTDMRSTHGLIVYVLTLYHQISEVSELFWTSWLYILPRSM